MFSYIHIPFCDNKCSYCRFASIGKLQDVQIERYVRHLIKEIEASPLTTLLLGEGNLLESIYFWGWTPSVLNINQIDSILIALRDRFWFYSSHNKSKPHPNPLLKGEGTGTEITLETTPINITKENLLWWKSIWINRISIWVQTLNSKSLKEIWRWNKWDIINALDNIKILSKDLNISLDFIIWLPYVKEWEIKKDIEYLLDNYTFIKHISVYMLEEYYSPDKIKETKYDSITYPDDWSSLWIKKENYLEEYNSINNFLEKKGFKRYEVSNFAKPWFECKHNKAYWNHSEVLAFWLWAWGFINWYRYMNSDNFPDYYSWNKLFVDELGWEDLFIEKVMFLLRTSWIEEDIYTKLDKQKLDYFLENNFLKLHNWKIKLENKWVLVMDYILSEII